MVSQFSHCSFTYAYATSCLAITLQAFDLLEMLKKEEEMLSAIKEKQLQVPICLTKRVGNV